MNSIRTKELMLLLLLATTFTHATELVNGERVEVMIDEIVSLLERADSCGIAEKKALITQQNELQDRLVNLGEDVVPILESRIDEGNNQILRRVLTQIIGRIPGECADRELMQLFCYDEYVAHSACSQLVLRIKENGPLSFLVPEVEIQIIINRIMKEHVYGIDEYMKVLAACVENPVESRISPILHRFTDELKNPAEEPQRFHDSITTPRAFMRRQFLLVFGCMGAEIRPYLRESIEKARKENNKEVEKWLYMGLGMTGDPNVAEFLKDVIKNDPDIYTRGEAIAPYVHSAGKESIPLLRELDKDKTVDEFLPEHVPYRYILANIAHPILIEMTEDDLQNTTYMNKINALLENHNMSKEDLFAVGSGQLESGTHGTRDEIPVSIELMSAFHRGDIDYICNYIEERRKQKEEDIFALVLEFNLNICRFEFETAYKNIVSMFEIIDSTQEPCKKFSKGILFSMVFSFEKKYREYIVFWDSTKPEEPDYDMECVYLSFLFERNKCL